MPEEAVLHMTQQQVEAYLEDLRVRHRTEETIQNYRTSLGQLYRDLPEGKPLGRETLSWWQVRLLASGYTPRTVNRALSVANSFFAFLGHRELQTSAFLEPPRDGRRDRGPHRDVGGGRRGIRKQRQGLRPVSRRLPAAVQLGG